MLKCLVLLPIPMHSRNYLLFVIITIIVIAAVAFLPERVFGATATAVSDLSTLSAGYQQPKTILMDNPQYPSLGVWPGMTISEVVNRTSIVSGLNALTVADGVIFGARATDVGFPAPTGTGDNLLAVQNNLLVSDYGPLTSHLTVAFVTRDETGKIIPATITAFGVKMTTSGSVKATFLDVNGKTIESVDLPAQASITCQQPFAFVVFEFSQAQGTGLSAITFDRASFNSAQTPPSQTPPSSTSPGTGSTQQTCPCQQKGSENTTTNNGTPGKVLGVQTVAPGIIVGASSGTPPEVRLYAPDGTLKVAFNAYEEHFKGGVQVGMGDVDGNGTTEIVTAPGPGSDPQIRIFNLNGQFITAFYAYDLGFHGGVNIAVGDIEGDGKVEIVTAPKRGGGPNVRIFGLRSGGFAPTTENFSAYDPKFHGGVNVALGDIDGDGQKDIVTAPESGGGPQLRIFSFKIGIYRPSILGLMAYDPNFRGGVNVAAGDIDGDGHAEVVTAPQRGGGPHVRIFGYTAQKDLGLRSPGFMAYDKNFTGGVHLAVIDLDNDGTAEIVTTPASSSAPLVRFFGERGQVIRTEFLAFPASRLDGLNIAPGYLE